VGSAARRKVQPGAKISTFFNEAEAARLKIRQAPMRGPAGINTWSV
jgi:hypothetical protein